MNLEDIDLSKLREPFPSSEIEFRIGRSGKNGDKFWATVLGYLTNRAIMNRLDETVQPENWWNEYREWHIGDKHGVLCGLTIRTPNGPVTKWDGAENTDIESIKGGLSDSMKRAAVQWGLGRYLYNLEETFVECKAEKERDWNYAKTKDGVMYWKTPELPKWALPVGKPPKAPDKPKETPKEQPKEDKKAAKVVKIPAPKTADEALSRISKKLEALAKTDKGILNDFSKAEIERKDKEQLPPLAELNAAGLKDHFEWYLGFLESRGHLEKGWVVE